MKQRIFALLVATLLILSLFAGCSKSTPATTDTTTTTEAVAEVITTGEVGVTKDEEFGYIYLNLTADEFNALGFKFGDSVDIAFDNGKELKDIPYNSGFYVPVGEMIVCGGADYHHVLISRHYSGSTWDEFELNENSKVTITRNEERKYSDAESSHSNSYSDNRAEFESDIVYANFREMKGDNIKKEYFYRSASPCNNSRARAPFANKFAEEYKINFVLNMSDDDEEYKSYVADPKFSSDYYNSLYEKGNVMLLGMENDYTADEYCKTFSEALLEMTKHEGPVLLHCVEGKDRTGFGCALILALAGASGQEITDDYMLTYYNYYGVTKESNPNKYDAVVVNVYKFACCMCEVEKSSDFGMDDLEKLDLKAGAKKYLAKGGLSDDQIKEIEDYITA